MSAEDLDWQKLKKACHNAIEPIAQIAERNLQKLTEITNSTKDALNDLSDILMSISEATDDPLIAQKAMKGLTTLRDFGLTFKDIITSDIED